MKPIADKVQAIVNFPKPSNMRQLRRLIGMIAFYKKFIPNCSEITRPIFSLLSPHKYSKKAIEWTKDADDAFQEVLNKLCSPVTLDFPVENAPTYLVIDAGAVLHQKIDGEIRLLAFFSCAFNKAQLKYLTPFTTLELSATIKLLKGGKAQGPDNILPELMMHCGEKCLEWVHKFYSFCFEHTVIPKIWRRATAMAILKPNKPADDPKSYRPISLLRVPYKILEKLILARMNSVIEPQLPTEQAGFRQGRSTVQQILKLTSEIEKSFENGHKAGAVMEDLAAAYDTVWRQGPALKLLCTIPDRHLVRFIMNILSNRNFKLKTSTGQISRLRILKNGLPQGSTLSPILFNIYISNIPTTVSHADDMALLYSHKCWPKVKETLSRDMEDLVDFSQT